MEALLNWLHFTTRKNAAFHAIQLSGTEAALREMHDIAAWRARYFLSALEPTLGAAQTIIFLRVTVLAQLNDCALIADIPSVGELSQKESAAP